MRYKLIVLFALFLVFQMNSVFAQGCESDDVATSNDSINKKVIVFGFMQPEYDYTLNDENENSFKFKRARVGVRGEIFKDFHYYFQIETSPFVNGDGSILLLDAFVSYRKYNWAQMSVGSFKQPLVWK